MPLFGKKKKKSDEDLLEVTDIAEHDKSEVRVKKKDRFSNLKKRAHVIFKLKLKRKKTDDDDSGYEPDDDSDSDGGGAKKDKAKKPKKEKKAAIKKPKKPKKKKVKKAKSSGDGQKKKLPIWIIIAAGSLVLGAVAFFIVTSMNKPSTEEQLANALLLFNEQKYTEADEIYGKLLDKDATLVPAHIGHAEVLVATEQTEAALESLNAALEPTGNDPQIQLKIDELSAPAEEETEAGDEANVASPGTTASPVSFSDSEFEKMIRLALKKSGSEQIMSDELASIAILKIMGGTHAAVSIPGKPEAGNGNIPSINRTESYTIGGEVYTERGTIGNLNDLKHFTGLKKLIVSYNSVTDISGISGLKGLDTLGLYCNNLTDISPISQLTSLEYLYIYNNRISDISPLSQLTGLRQLWLNKNDISDISPLKGLDKLTELFLKDNRIQDISVVSGFKSLGFLYFDNNQVSDISAVKDLTSLTDISFTGNPVDDTSPALHVKHINEAFF